MLISLGLALASAALLYLIRSDPFVASWAVVAAAIVLLPPALGVGRPRLKRALLIAASLLLVFAALDAEVAILFKPRITVEGGGGYVARDPLLGYRPRPGARAAIKWGRFGQSIYDAHYSIDQVGFRLTRSSAAKDADTTVFLGDSYVFGDGLNDGDTLPQQFSAAKGYRQRVINAAFSGYGAQQVLRLIGSDRLGSQLGTGRRLFIYPVIEEHVRRIEGRSPLDWMGSPRYVLDGGQARLAGRFHPGLDGVLLGMVTRSAIVAALHNQSMLEPTGGSPELFGAMVQQARDEAARRYGARFVVLLWDEPILRDRDQHNPARAQRRAAMVETIAAELKRRGVEVLRVSQLIPDYPARMPAYIIGGSGHPSALANRRIAEALAARF